MKKIFRKDFKRALKHKIFYNQIINFDTANQIDIKEMKRSISNVNDETFDDADNSKYISGSLEDDLNNDLKNEKKNRKKTVYKNEDGYIIEYCPKIFKFIRDQDKITDYQLVT
jgi:hypothetical protein